MKNKKNLIELTILIPCLNEDETLGICLKKIKKNLKELNIKSEVLVADNGSTDNSLIIAKKYGAKIINVKTRGYGAALKKGIKKSSGKYILFADADDSYDFNQIKKFYKKITSGYDLVQGCRFPRYGGKIKKGAMPFSHQYIGNPFLSFLAKIFYKLPLNDIYCGMRIFKSSICKNTNFISDGMVFAIEHLIKINYLTKNICEIPITLHKDGRKNKVSHLRTFSDGFDSLKFLLIFLPKIIFFIPAFIMSLIAIIILSEFFLINFFMGAIVKMEVFVSILLMLLTYQMIMFGISTRFIAIEVGLENNNNKMHKFLSLKNAIIISSILFIVGIFLLKSDYLFFLNKNQTITLSIFFIFLSFINLINSVKISLIEILSKKTI